MLLTRFKLLFFFALLFFTTGLFSQNTVYLTYGIPASAYGWDGKKPISDFFGLHYGGNVLLILGTSDTSLFAVTCQTISDAKGNTESKLIEVGKKGSYAEWRIYYEDEEALDDKQEKEFKYLAKKKLSEYVKKFKLDQLETTRVWISGDNSYVAKVNSYELNVCFTWNLLIDDSEHSWSFEWAVETGSFETHRDISYNGVVFDLEIPCYYGMGKDSVMQLVTKTDSFLVRKNKPYTEYLPHEWIPDWSLTVYEDSMEIIDLEEKLKHISPELKKKFPLLSTHTPELLFNNDGFSVMLILKPKNGKNGRIYGWYGVTSFINGGTEFFIIFVKTSNVNLKSQERLIEVFKNIKGR